MTARSVARVVVERSVPGPTLCRICEICVVLPDPVSPMTTTTGLVRIASTMSSAYRSTGRQSQVSTGSRSAQLEEVFRPNGGGGGEGRGGRGGG
jgi:hypothetical protein